MASSPEEAPPGFEMLYSLTPPPDPPEIAPTEYKTLDLPPQVSLPHRKETLDVNRPETAPPPPDETLDHLPPDPAVLPPETAPPSPERAAAPKETTQTPPVSTPPLPETAPPPPEIVAPPPTADSLQPETSLAPLVASPPPMDISPPRDETLCPCSPEPIPSPPKAGPSGWETSSKTLSQNEYENLEQDQPPMEIDSEGEEEADQLEKKRKTSEQEEEETFPPGYESLDPNADEAAPPGYEMRDQLKLETEPPPGFETMVPTSVLDLTVPFPGVGQMVCGNCRQLLCYPRGTIHVQCASCQTVNLVLEACQVGNVKCGQCTVLLMYPFGAPFVRCSSCLFITEIGAHNIQPPLAFQQILDAAPLLELESQSTISS